MPAPSIRKRGLKVEIIPSSIGLPTVFDKDIIIYCISKLKQAHDRGEPIAQKVKLTTHEHAGGK